MEWKGRNGGVKNERNSRREERHGFKLYSPTISEVIVLLFLIYDM